MADDSSPTDLAGVDALGLDLPEVRQLTRTANHQNQATADRRDSY